MSLGVNRIAETEMAQRMTHSVAKASKSVSPVRGAGRVVGAGGARAAFLTYAERFKHLKRIDLRDNYFTQDDEAALRKLLPMALFADQKEFVGEDDRYVSVSE